MDTRPVTDAEIAGLLRVAPVLRDCGEHAGLGYWVVRYSPYPDPMVEAWRASPYFQASVWMPRATRERVRAWIETLKVPVARVAA